MTVWTPIRLGAHLVWQESPVRVIASILLPPLVLARLGGQMLVLSCAAGVLLVILRGRHLLRNRLEPAGRLTVVGGSISLRPLTRRDAAAVAETIDHVMMRANGWTDANRESAIAAFAARPCTGRLGSYAIVEQAAHTLVGVISLRHDPGAPRGPNIGLWVGADGRGRGFGEAALRTLMLHTHESGIASAYLGTASDNAPMCRLALRAGGTEVERGPHRLPDGTVAESVWYEFRAMPTGTSRSDLR